MLHGRGCSGVIHTVAVYKTCRATSVVGGISSLVITLIPISAPDSSRGVQ